ncbi:MAG: hypothetical protein QW334_03675 [Thermofilum sp.]
MLMLSKQRRQYNNVYRLPELVFLMSSEKTIVWSLRLITIAMVLVPPALHYFSSGSLQDFLVPGLTLPSSSIFNIQHSLQVTSVDYSIVGDTCLLSVGLSNAGSIGVGLKKLDCRIYVTSLNLSGRLVLNSPFILKPGGAEMVNFSFFLESGTYEDLLRVFSQKPAASLSGEATIVLDSAELPLTLSVTNLPISLLAPW